ncbi:hypothetical protein MHBO_001581 [Bonamia ostreae]|uniref:WW domain-containing protein n=1 Tax=Bonamia ostreae TaxID=126728 RepID=A0ABV2AJH0_9EUKA
MEFSPKNYGEWTQYQENDTNYFYNNVTAASQWAIPNDIKNKIPLENPSPFIEFETKNERRFVNTINGRIHPDISKFKSSKRRTNVKLKEFDIREQCFQQLLDENGIDESSNWNDVKIRLCSDPRFYLISSRSKRLAVFEKWQQFLITEKENLIKANFLKCLKSVLSKNKDWRKFGLGKIKVFNFR